MKKLSFFSFVILLLIITHNPILADSQKAEYIHVSPSVVMVNHPFGSNFTCVALADGLIFIDCGMNSELVGKFRQDMEIKYGKKTLALLITHPHIDHYLGMGAFADVKVVAAEAGKKTWGKQLAIEFTPERIETYDKVFKNFAQCIKTAKPFMPGEWMQQQKVFGKGSDQLVFTNTGGHTDCSSSAYFAKEKVLVSGDLVQADQYPYFGDPTNNMMLWLNTFEKWLAMPIDKVCPGHGRVVDKNYIKLMDNYFNALISALKNLKKQGLPEDQVVGHASLPKGYWDTTRPKPVWFDICIAVLYNRISID